MPSPMEFEHGSWIDTNPQIQNSNSFWNNYLVNPNEGNQHKKFPKIACLSKIPSQNYSSKQRIKPKDGVKW